ncbi:CHAT domain-containing protein [Pseudomonas sp. LS1212]|uniref:CHAT domain-containing protein n=1 Tax=Pseudomonas sp. LS1212 TaxID=2972478 RepID=UPI00215D2882|nr:CHAT domain-containing protein [Pseudomonas sp. LS1212]UVJ41798.1 CHAT domain-containing protein [Pseudomonas sp. LS1212]
MKPTDVGSEPQPALKLPLSRAGSTGGTLPQALTVPGSRSQGGAGISLLGNVQVKRTWQLAPASRSGDAPHTEVLSSNQGLLALEATDGTTIFIRTDTLVAQLRRSRPELVDEDGVIDFARLRDSQDVGRGALGWVWQQITELALTEDAITAAAREQITDALGGVVIDWAARRSAKVLMAVVEKSLAGEPGLYRWDGGLLKPQDLHAPLDARLEEAAQSGPLLVFIHGTGSHTLGSFGDLPGTGAWRALQNTFGQRIFGFEHRTFSESPIDNALALVNTLAPGTRLNIVTHSRGGLIGDLLCLDPSDKGLGELIERYRSNPRPDEAERERENTALASEREQVAAEEQAKLRQLVDLLKQKNLQVGRYVRVAAPARGTALLSDNLDVFLSCLLGLVRRFGAWSIGAAAGLVATPVAGAKARELADAGLKFLSRVVLEIADKRLEPQTVPGIEAMLPEAPMGMLLGRARVSPSVRIAVIAGDIEAAGAGVLQRVGVMFVDWAFFDRARNDLVVDTDSMYGGILSRVTDARAIFVHSAQVNHFRYFRDDVKYLNLPLPNALGAWLLDATPQARAPWQEPLALPDLEPAIEVSKERGEAPVATARPVLIFLPGIMGSHLAADGNRVWLDPLGLATGSLPRIAMTSRRTVSKDGLVTLTYAKLIEHLQLSHQVIIHDYDWRQPIATLGKGLASVMRKALTAHPDQPVRILAHSMGGLLVRAAFAADKTLWPELVARPGGRLLMLGTPNQGSYSFVETLLGQADTMRMLARVDVTHNLQDILNVVAGFPGALHLLPAPGFEDAAGPAVVDFYQENSWLRLARLNDDFWFGNNLGGRPGQAALDEARGFWRDMQDCHWVDLDHERIAYVFGKADNTACGVQIVNEGSKPVRVMMRGTPNGDGSVTWRSGRLQNLPEERYWYMPVDHGGLTNTTEFFSEIQALLSKGVPNKLGRLPVSRGEEQRAPLIIYRGGPPAYPTDQELVSRMLGSRGSMLRSRKKKVLQVIVKAMDLSFVQVPIMCGHYRGDPIAGAEAVIDQTLVNGALSHRQRLGIHSGELGNATVVLMPRSAEEHLRQTGRGALIVGLGEMGTLSSEGVTQAVRAGVLRYLLHASDFYGKEQSESTSLAQGSALSLRLASLLIGTNSSAQLSIGDSVKAVVLGVLLANRDFAAGAAERGATQAFISRLEMVEVFRDTAISAAYAVSELDKNLVTELSQLETKLELADELQYGEGVRQRLSVNPFSDYWPRLSVSSDDLIDGTPSHDGTTAPVLLRARSFRFAYMGEKARVEALVEQRQPGLVEKLVDSALKGRGCTDYQKHSFFGNTLFQLLLPLEFKSSVRRSRNLILMVDESSANLPWEMLEADGEPLIKRTRMIRQFITERFRRQVIRTDSMTACVIANPSTEGYYTQFGGADWKQRVTPTGAPQEDRLQTLDGAEKEGEAVAHVLEGAGYTTYPVSSGAGAGEVFTQLFARPYRVLVISAHGIFGKAGADGIYRSGVVLSDGLLLTAAEIDRMEIVPDLVFLSCCHLAKVEEYGKNDNRLAASLARELINMGVRCVVAAGWEVGDEAAKTFAETFFMRMAMHGDSFGAAISHARLSTLDSHAGCNTWGAYQAYGDPSFQLKLLPGDIKLDVPLRAPEELLDWLERIRLAALAPCAGTARFDFETLSRRVAQRLRTLPPQWAQMPEVQYTLGLLYSECGQQGYEAACTALLQSIAADFARAIVPLRSVEQLINIEARRAQALAEQAQLLRKTARAEDESIAREMADSALVLINAAIARAAALIKLASPHPDSPDDVQSCDVVHSERQAILGSAYKRKAVILWMASKPWKVVEPILIKARDAYALGEGDPNMPGWNPYARINRLQLDALLGNVHADPSDVVRCQTAARVRFQNGFDFFDAVMSADAAVAGWLLTGNLPQAKGVVADNEVAGLCNLYWDALQGQRASVRQFDSVVKQLGLLASFLSLRGGKGDLHKAQTLESLAEALQKGDRLEVLACDLPFKAAAEATAEPARPGTTATARARSRAGKPKGK